MGWDTSNVLKSKSVLADLKHAVEVDMMDKEEVCFLQMDSVAMAPTSVYNLSS